MANILSLKNLTLLKFPKDYLEISKSATHLSIKCDPVVHPSYMFMINIKLSSVSPETMNPTTCLLYQLYKTFNLVLA